MAKGSPSEKQKAKTVRLEEFAYLLGCLNKWKTGDMGENGDPGADGRLARGLSRVCV